MSGSSATELSAANVFSLPGHLLRRCHQISVAIFLEETHAFDLTPPQYVTLAALAHHGALDKATLGGLTALDRTTISVVLGNLSERGLVVTRPSERDRRAKINEITEAGRCLLTDAEHAVAVSQDRLLAPLSKAERRQLVGLLSKVATENNLLSRAPHRMRRVRSTY